MNKPFLSICSAALLMLSGCNETPKEEKPDTKAAVEQTEAAAPDETVAAGGIYGVDQSSIEQKNDPHAALMAQYGGGNHSGKVLEILDAAGYTYVKVQTDSDTYWIAGPKTALNTGDTISYVEQMWMHNFHSKSLNRDFEKLMFVMTIVPPGAQTAGSDCDDCDTHKPHAQSAPAATKVEKAEGGYSVEEIYAKKAELNGQSVKVSGKVVKLSRNIMGKDWVHLQDGTGSQGTNDLVITSASATVSEGDIVTASGVVKADVDLGYGYKYSVLLEETTFSK